MAFLPDRKEYARASHVCIVTRVRHMRNPLLRRFISEAMDGQAMDGSKLAALEGEEGRNRNMLCSLGLADFIRNDGNYQGKRPTPSC